MWTGPHVNCQLRHPRRYALTAGSGARRSVSHRVLARRVHGAPPSLPPQFSSSDGIWHHQIEPSPTWRMTARYGISCDKRRPHLSPQLQPDMAQGTVIIYVYTVINMTAGMLKPWLMVARNCLRCSALEKRSGQLRPYVRPVDANFVAGHHGCSLTCRAPIC
jgi:hypothetical protein